MASCKTIGSVTNDTYHMVTVTQHQQITEATQIMFENHIGSLVVVAGKDDETMVGIISERDILEWISKATHETYSLSVGDIMTKDVISCDTETPLDEAWEIMRMHNIRHLPILKNGRAVKMLSLRDLLDYGS